MRKSSAMPVSVSPMLMRWFAFALACAVALGETRDCDAATFCVKTSAQFKSALGSSQGNGEDNTIYVKSGEYALNTDLGDGLAYGALAGHALTLIGSIDDVSVCPPANPVPDLAGAGTTLDGQHAVRPLQISSGDHVEIRGFTFVAGLSGPLNGQGGGLEVSGQDVVIRYNSFIGNHATGVSGEGGAVSGFASTTISFIDNLIAANHGTSVGGVDIYGTNGGEVSGNTITGNITDDVSLPGGMLLSGGGNASFSIVNNIIWNNHASGGTDLGVHTAQTRATNDLYFPLTPGSTSAGFTSDVSVDPQFESCGLCLSFELAAASPLIDAGTYQNYPTDLAGKPRVIGPHIDIGAFENIAGDFIFADDFQ